MNSTQQHKYEVWASAALYLTFSISLITDLTLRRGYFAAHKSTGEYFTLYAVNPFLLYVYYQIRKGSRGAKTLFLTLYAFVLYHLLSGELTPGQYDTPFKLGSLVAQHLVQVTACVLLLLSLSKPKDVEPT